jgi:hypothetical protein
MSLSQRVRFEVFKRDRFTCQYCGRKAPDVILHADHVTPRAAGGEDDILNLVTSCRECNLGKSDRMLSDQADIEVRRKAMEELEARRSQLEMLRDWHVSLSSLDEQAAEMLWDVWCSVAVVSRKMEEGEKASLMQLLKKYSFDEVVEGMRTACSKRHSGDIAFAAIGKFCRLAKMENDDPVDCRRRYILGILRNRLNYVNLATAATAITDAINRGVNVDYIEQSAKAVVSWTQFRDILHEACCEVENSVVDDWDLGDNE